MLKKVALIGGTSSLLAVVMLGLGAGSAMAATVASTNVGSNIGTWLASLGGALLIPIAGLFGLAAFFKRDVGHAITIVVIAAIVGIFIYDKSGAVNMITGIANTFTGGK